MREEGPERPSGMRKLCGEEQEYLGRDLREKWLQGLWEVASVGALMSPLPVDCWAYPEGRHAFQASPEGSETLFALPAYPAGSPSGSRGLLPALAAQRGRGKGRAWRPRLHPRPPGRSPLLPSTESPTPVLIWASGSNSPACRTSLLPNLVLDIALTQWRKGSARHSGGRSLCLKGPRHEYVAPANQFCIIFWRNDLK